MGYGRIDWTIDREATDELNEGDSRPDDEFVVRVAENTTGTVTVTVIGVNDPPVAEDDAIAVAEGGTVTVLMDGVTTSVLTNDTDAEGDDLTAWLVTPPAHHAGGVFRLESDGTFSYQHDGSETTTDRFTYRVTDDGNLSDEATVTIMVTGENDAPTAQITVPAPDDRVVISGRMVSVSGIGTDIDTEDNLLIYTWSEAFEGEALAGTFSPNGDNAAQNVQTWTVPSLSVDVGCYGCHAEADGERQCGGTLRPRR